MDTNSSFSNEQVDISMIPSVKDIELTGLDKNHLTVDLIATGIIWSIIGIGLSVSFFFNSDEIETWIARIVLIVLLFIIICSFLLLIFGFKKKKYALREKDIIYQEGLFWRTYTVLPFNRVQHAEVQQGPIERLFSLGKLKIYTAGGSSSDLAISGLQYETAQSMKHYILHQTSIDEEE